MKESPAAALNAIGAWARVDHLLALERRIKRDPTNIKHASTSGIELGRFQGTPPDAFA